jgi:GH24 family phage-related lysozyme (muramidase)
MTRLPDFPVASVSAQPAKPLLQGRNVKGGALAALLGISITAAIGTMSDVQRHESGRRRPLAAYLDSVGVPTICDGIIRYPDGRPVRMDDTATEDQCDAYFEHEIVDHARPLVVGIPQLYGRENQMRALVDETYNCGVAFVVNGSVGKNIRAGNWAAAKDHIADCSRGTFKKPIAGRDCTPKRTGGWLCVIPGLLARRRDNQARFSIDLPAQGAR